MLQEFKKFALRGNVLDMAVGVIIGGAFGKIVTSLVNDIIMPVLGILTGRINLRELKWVIREANGDVAELAVTYGQFLQVLLDFFIISFSIFMVIKLIGSFRKKHEEKPEEKPEEPKRSPEELLLAEIRDILKEGKN